MSIDLIEIWAHMGILAKSVAFALLVMAVASVGVVVERVVTFAKGQAASRRFAAEAAKALDAWDLDKLRSLAESHKASPLARVFGRMAQSFQRGVEKPGELSAPALARHEAERCLEASSADLRRGMTVLASVGSVAPFVGLLGTVLGIISAFDGIGAAGSAGLSSVMTGISEALIETAFGLLVAIPAVLFYNYLSGRVSGIELALTQSVGELLDEMENQHGNEQSKRIKQAA